MFNAKTSIIDIEFDNDVNAPSWIDPTNPYHAKRLIDEIWHDVDTVKLQKLLKEHNEKTTSVSKYEIKEVFIMLKNREIHPQGDFDKQGRFYLDDRELVDVRAPSYKYPYSEMNAGRTSKFVKAIAEKYKCANKEDLLKRFSGL